MSRDRWRCAPRGYILACVLVSGLDLAGAGIVFDDHFDGDSGGMPAQWFGEGEGSVVESGSLVMLQDEFGIGTQVDLDPNQSAVTTIVTMIAGTSNHTHCGIIDFGQLENHFWVKLWAADGRIEVKASNLQQGEEEHEVGHVDGYDGGPTTLTIVLEAETFTIATDQPAYSSGPVAYASVFSSFTREDLGHAAKLILESECSPTGPPCASSYDRITMEVGASTPVAATSWSAVRDRYRR